MAGITPYSVVVASPDQVSADLAGDAAILQLRNGVYYTLDPVGARVWSLLRNPHSVADLEDILLKEYEVEPEECRRDLLELLEELLAAGLILEHQPMVPGNAPQANR